MKYRAFGRTGLRVSDIGLGGHREGVETCEGLARTARFFRSAQDRARVVGRAIELGVNYFDSTFGCELASLGESLRILGRRDGLFVSGMRVDFFGNLLREQVDPRLYTRREVEGRLVDFGQEQIDQFLLGALEVGDPLSHPRAIMEDVFAELEKLRDEGKIRFVGFSCHNPDYAARLLEAFPNFDSAMVPYNYAFRQAEGNLAEILRKTGAAFIGMKPLVWQAYGLPVTLLRNLRPIPDRLDFDPTASIARLALQFVLGNPLLTTTVPAINTIEAVDENLAASEYSPLTADDEQTLAQYARAMVSENVIPLAIAGLMEENLRVRANAFHLIGQNLGWAVPAVDWAGDNAEACAEEGARALLEKFSKDPLWSPYVSSSPRA